MHSTVSAAHCWCITWCAGTSKVREFHVWDVNLRNALIWAGIKLGWDVNPQIDDQPINFDF